MVSTSVLVSEIARTRAQIKEAIAILENGTDYEKLHVVSILENALDGNKSNEDDLHSYKSKLETTLLKLTEEIDCWDTDTSGDMPNFLDKHEVACRFMADDADEPGREACIKALIWIAEEMNKQAGDD